MLVLSSNVLRSTQVFMAVLSLMNVIRRVYIEKYKTHIITRRRIIIYDLQLLKKINQL